MNEFFDRKNKRTEFLGPDNQTRRKGHTTTKPTKVVAYIV